MDFSHIKDPFKVIGVSDDISRDALDIAYNNCKNKILSKNPISLQGLEDLKFCYDFVKYERGFEEGEFLEESERFSYIPPDTIEYEQNDEISDAKREIIDDAENFIERFEYENSNVEISFLYLIIYACLLFVTFVFIPLITLCFVLLFLYLLRNSKEISHYSIYIEEELNREEIQQNIVSLRDSWLNLQKKFKEEKYNACSAYLDNFTIEKSAENGEIYGVRERAKQFPSLISTALDVLDNQNNLARYVGEKSSQNIINWAKNIQGAFEETSEYKALEYKFYEEKYGLAEEIVREETRLNVKNLRLKECLEKIKILRLFVFVATKHMDNINDSVGDYPNLNEKDGLYDKSVALVIKEQKASVSWLQRQLDIGYHRTTSIIEEMERQGVISPADSSGKRTVLIKDKSKTRIGIIIPLIMLSVLYFSVKHGSGGVSTINNSPTLELQKPDAVNNPNNIAENINYNNKSIISDGCINGDKTYLDILICRDSELKLLDEQINTSIIKLREITDVEKWETIRINQGNWLISRAENCNIKADNINDSKENLRVTLCLRDFYKMRSNELMSTLATVSKYSTISDEREQ